MTIWQILTRRKKKYENLADFEMEIEKNTMNYINQKFCPKI